MESSRKRRRDEKVQREEGPGNKTDEFLGSLRSGGHDSMRLPGQMTTREEIEEMALSGDTFVESDFSPEEHLFEEALEQNGSDADESTPDHDVEEDEVSDDELSSYSEDDPTEEEEEEASYLEHSSFYSCDRLARAEDLRPAEACNPPIFLVGELLLTFVVRGLQVIARIEAHSTFFLHKLAVEGELYRPSMVLGSVARVPMCSCS
jgi:hypothetical protein